MTTLLVLLAFASVVSFMGLRTSYWPLKALAGIIWIGLAFYWNGNLPTGITAGDTVDTFVYLVLLGLGLAMIFMPFWYTSGGEQGKGFRVTMNRLLGREEEEEKPEPTRGSRASEYRDKVNSALRGNVRRRY